MNNKTIIIIILFLIPLVTAETSSSSLNWASKKFVDNNFLSLFGGTMKGNIDMGSYNIINATWVNATKINTTQYYSKNIYIDNINSYSGNGINVNDNVSVNGNTETDMLKATDNVTIETGKFYQTGGTNANGGYGFYVEVSDGYSPGLDPGLDGESWVLGKGGDGGGSAMLNGGNGGDGEIRVGVGGSGSPDGNDGYLLINQDDQPILVGYTKVIYDILWGYSDNEQVMIGGNEWFLQDGTGILFGGGKDSKLSYDGSDTVLENLVGSGKFEVDMDLNVTGNMTSRGIVVEDGRAIINRTISTDYANNLYIGGDSIADIILDAHHANEERYSAGAISVGGFFDFFFSDSSGMRWIAQDKDSIATSYPDSSPSWYAGASFEWVMNTSAFSPMTDNSNDIGTPKNELRNIYVDSIGYIDRVDAEEGVNIFSDSAGFIMGEGGDSKLSHDGSDTVLENLVGSGNFKVDMGIIIEDTWKLDKGGAGTLDILWNDGFADNTYQQIDTSGNVYYGGNLIPFTTNSYDIGSSSFKWKEAYLIDDVNVVSDSKGLVLGAGGDSRLYYDGSDTVLENLVGSGKFEVDMGLNVTGNITTNQIYGEMCKYNDSGDDVTFGAGNTYYNFTFKDTKLNGFTFEDNALIPIISGRYHAKYSASGSGDANSIYKVVVAVNNIAENCTSSFFRTGNTNDVVSMSGTGMIDILAGDKVTLQIKDITGAGSGKRYASNINLVRIGD